MDAFLKGRAAISHKDMVTKQEQADIIIAQFDVMNAGVVIQELNEMQYETDIFRFIVLLSN